MNEDGEKFDSNKPDWSLLPLDAVEEVVKVLTFGANKYERNNWKLVEPTTRYKAALLRHLTAQDRNEDIDPETGISHAAHVACNAIFLLWFEMHKKCS